MAAKKSFNFMSSRKIPRNQAAKEKRWAQQLVQADGFFTAFTKAYKAADDKAPLEQVIEKVKNSFISGYRDVANKMPDFMRTGENEPSEMTDGHFGVVIYPALQRALALPIVVATLSNYGIIVIAPAPKAEKIPGEDIDYRSVLKHFKARPVDPNSETDQAFLFETPVFKEWLKAAIEQINSKDRYEYKIKQPAIVCQYILMSLERKRLRQAATTPFKAKLRGAGPTKDYTQGIRANHFPAPLRQLIGINTTKTSELKQIPEGEIRARFVKAFAKDAALRVKPDAPAPTDFDLECT